MKKKFLTQEGYDKLVAELRDLEDIQLPEVFLVMKEAQEAGDLSENSDYHSAKDKQALMHTRIGQLKEMIKDVEIVEKDDLPSDNVVRYQSVVTLETDDGKIMTCKIVGSGEVDILAEPQQISFDSPIGSAIEGHKKGDVVAVKLTNKSQIKIIDVA